MNQPSQTPVPQNQPAVSKWLWITLIIVVLIGGAFAAWYYLSGPGKKVATSTTTATTTPATTTTTGTSATTTPTTTTTTTPSTSTSTGTTAATATTTPPTGWKNFDFTMMFRGHGISYGVSVWGKDDWNIGSNYSPAYAEYITDKDSDPYHYKDTTKESDKAYIALISISGCSPAAKTLKTSDGKESISLCFGDQALTSDEKTKMIDSFKLK